MENERRRKHRLSSFFPVQVEADGEQPREAVCCDISGSGMLLATAESVELGTRVVLSFEPPGSDARRIVSGRVVRADPNEGDGAVLWPQTIGVQFDAFDPVLGALAKE